MKLLSALLLLTSLNALACQQDEAQFIAEVTRVETDSMQYCRAFISSESISMYNEHALCPLDQGEVIAKGIEFPLINGHDCEVYVGDTISGYLYTSHGKIRID